MGNNKYFGSIKPVLLYLRLSNYIKDFESNEIEKKFISSSALALVGTGLPSAKVIASKMSFRK